MYGEMYKNAKEVLLGVVLWIVMLLSLWGFLMVARLAVAALAKDDRKRVLFIIGLLVLIIGIVVGWSISLGGLRF